MLERKEKFFLVMLFVIIFSLLLYFVPKTTRFEHTLHAVILDREGNQIGTTDIALQGAKLEYLFRNTLLDVTISPFDRYLRFNLTEALRGIFFTEAVGNVQRFFQRNLMEAAHLADILCCVFQNRVDISAKLRRIYGDFFPLFCPQTVFQEIRQTALSHAVNL